MMPTFRLAPTPSGFLHQGNAFNFLLNWLYAKQLGTNILLRIDDLDATRSRVEYVTDIFETLHWLKIDWDLGPKNVIDFQQNWSQSLRLPNYQQQLERLIAKGLIFACDCSRKSLQEAGAAGAYPGICENKNLPLNENFAWRVRVPSDTIIKISDVKEGMLEVNLSAAMGSFVIKTRDGIPAYQLASLCDDVQFGVTHVIRGADLLASTAAQLYLAEILELQQFKNIQFYHHPLLTDLEGNKLSKSAGSLSLQHLRANHYTPSDLLQELAIWMGISLQYKALKPEDLLPFLPPLFKI